MSQSEFDEGHARQDRRAKVLTYGEAMAMFVAETVGELSSVERFTRRLAGADLNVAIGFSRLDFEVAYLSRVGDDSFGRHVLQVLDEEGIDASHVCVDPRYATGFQLKARAAHGEDPTVEYFRRNSAASHLSPEDLDAGFVARFDHLHLTGVAPAISSSSRELAQGLAEHARAAGMTLSFDPNLRPTLWPDTATMVSAINDLARYAHWVLPGLAEGEILTGQATPAGIADFYLALGVRAVIVKLGAAGAYYADSEGGRGTIDAIAVPLEAVIDTVGAGDAFAVGAVSALLEGKTLPLATRRGVLLGALAVQVVGDSEALPRRAELDRLERSEPREPRQAATLAPAHSRRPFQT